MWNPGGFDHVLDAWRHVELPLEVRGSPVGREKVVELGVEAQMSAPPSVLFSERFDQRGHEGEERIISHAFSTCSRRVFVCPIDMRRVNLSSSFVWVKNMAPESFSRSISCRLASSPPR